MLTRNAHYENVAGAHEDTVYRATGSAGVAWRVLGWETEPDEDTEWSGYEVRTGRLSAYMVGDDKVSTFEPDDLIPIGRDEYCGECGQIGCGHDGR